MQATNKPCCRCLRGCGDPGRRTRRCHWPGWGRCGPRWRSRRCMGESTCTRRAGRAGSRCTWKRMLWCRQEKIIVAWELQLQTIASGCRCGTLTSRSGSYEGGHGAWLLPQNKTKKYSEAFLKKIFYKNFFYKVLPYYTIACQITGRRNHWQCFGRIAPKWLAVTFTQFSQ